MTLCCLSVCLSVTRVPLFLGDDLVRGQTLWALRFPSRAQQARQDEPEAGGPYLS
jgi:hypothetical protein